MTHYYFRRRFLYGLFNDTADSSNSAASTGKITSEQSIGMNAMGYTYIYIYKGEGKGKVLPRTGHEGPEGGVEV